MGGVRLDVPAADVERAGALLNQPPLPVEPKRCVRCGAEARAALGRKGYVAALLSFLFVLPMLAKKKYWCAACRLPVE
jgi:hypothetical protein